MRQKADAPQATINYYTEGTIGYGGMLQMQFIATTIYSRYYNLYILGALKGDYRCTTGLLPYWSSGGFSRWTSVGIHYWHGVQLGDYWDASWGTTEGTLLKYYSGTTEGTLLKYYSGTTRARARTTTGGLQGR